MNWRDLRIAVVGPLPPPAGGMARQTLEIAENLRNEGAVVHIVQTNGPYWPASIGAIRGLRAIVRLFAFVAQLWAVSNRVNMFHVMANSGWSWHLYAAPAIWLGRLRGVRVVVSYHGGEAREFLTRSSRWVLPTLRRSESLIVPSPYLQQVFEAFECASIVVPNVVDLGHFHPTSGGKLPPVRTDNPWHETDACSRDIVLFVPRNLERIYGVETALRALAILIRTVPKARMVIAGSGAEENSLRHLAGLLALEERVEFTGRLDREQMAARYRTASVVLNPSTVDNAPVSLLEALASGVPVVTTDVGGIPFIVEHGRTALLVPPGDPKAMAEAALRVLSDSDLAQRLRSEGLAEAKRYGWSHVRESLARVYLSPMRCPMVGESTAPNR